MKKYIVLLVMAFSFINSGYKAKAQGMSSGSQISADSTVGCLPLPVNFTAPLGVTNPVWDFGDFNFSLDQNPSHIYTTPGMPTFTVTLHDGTIFVDSIIIRVNDPSVDFSGTPRSGCIGLNVAFSDLSTTQGAPIVNREWVFGDGGTDTTGNPSSNHTYTSVGSFPVTLRVTDSNGCVASNTKPNFVSTSIPTAIITSSPNPPAACNPPLDVNFSGASSFGNSTTGTGLTYSWEFGDSTFSNIAAPTKTYTSKGSYNAQLTVTDNNGCSDSAVTTVLIDQTRSSFEVLGAVNDTVCPDVTFINHSTPGVYIWTFGDGSPPSSGIDSVSHGYLNPGIYNVGLQVTNGGCTDDTIIPVIVSFLALTCDKDSTGSPWNIIPTGENHSIIINPTSMVSVINNYTFTIGDFLAAFFEYGGMLQPAGVGKWTGATIQFPVYGNDASFPTKNGFYVGEDFQWFAYNSSTGQITKLVVKYLAPGSLGGVVSDSGKFVIDGVSAIKSMAACAKQNIAINTGWNIVSSYIKSNTPNILDVISGISNDILLLKNELGQTAIPSLGINLIGDWEVTEGYKLKAANNTTLTISCEQVVPESTPIIISAGWNIIAYLRTSAMDASVALDTIKPNILLVKDNIGNAYLPGLGINNISDLQSGQGYKIKMNVTDTLYYPGN